MTAGETCGCEFYGLDHELHDRLLGLETLEPIAAVELVALLIADDDPFTGAPEAMFSDPSDFGRFVMAHNWNDPVAMASLAGYVSPAWEQAWRGRRSQGLPGLRLAEVV